jgi:hypothetical protein
LFQVDEEGVEDFNPFLGKLQQYLDMWATASQNVVVEPRLHDDDAWRAYLQWYTARSQTRVTYAPLNPRLDLVPSVYVPLPTGSVPQHLSKFFCINSN